MKELTKENILEKLRESVTDAIYPISMGNHIDIEKLNELVGIAEETTRLFKDDEYISKKLLIELFSSADGLKNDNEYLKRKELDEISDRLMLCYNLLIAGKTIDEV
ncbi:MAG: hypothetical protein KGV44_06585 [Flavobacteriaceae bacterium]|nr:hypothetical protein [Flavobacteriaceae bacterium]